MNWLKSMYAYAVEELTAIIKTISIIVILVGMLAMPLYLYYWYQWVMNHG